MASTTLNTVRSSANGNIVVAGSFAPQGASAPTVISGGLDYTVVRTSAGLFTLTLKHGYQGGVLDGQVDLQLASVLNTTASLTSGSGNAAVTFTAGSDLPGSLGNDLTVTIAQSANATYTWTDATDSDVVQFIGAGAFAGSNGNNLKVAVVTGAALANAITYSAGVTTVTITINTGTTTPALLKTYVNTTAASTLGGFITIGTATGTTPFTVFLSATSLTGGVGNTAGSLTASSNGLDVTVNLAVAGSTATQVTAAINGFSNKYMTATAGGTGAGTVLTAVQANLAGGATNSLTAQIGTISNITGWSSGLVLPTIQIRVLDTNTGSLTDIAANAGNLVHFSFELLNTTAQ